MQENNINLEHMVDIAELLVSNYTFTLLNHVKDDIS